MIKNPVLIRSLQVFCSLILMANLSIGASVADRDIRDDDCLGIAMRPLPRFGKRALVNQETIDRFKRSCIMSRRQSKSDRSLIRNPEDVDETSIRNNPAYWRYLVERLAAQRDKAILERVLNRRIRDSNEINAYSQQPTTTTSTSLRDYSDQNKLFESIKPFLARIISEKQRQIA